jgi:hypothetical protein
MHRNLGTVPLLALVSLIAGCAPTATVEAFDQRIGTYVGHPEAEVIRGLGVPNRTYDDPSGRRLLQYDFLSPATGPSVVPTLGLGFGSFGGGVGIGTGLGLGFGSFGQPALLDCSVIFEIRDGRVQSFSRRGEGCTAPVLS